MKKSQLKQIIKEEIRKVLKENVTIDPALLTALKTALKSRIRYPEDEGAHDDMQMTLARIYKMAGLENPKELAAGKYIVFIKGKNTGLATQIIKK
jgi:hypothetical protein